MFRVRNIFKNRTLQKLPLLILLVRRDTPLKKTATAIAVSVLAVLIVAPIVRSVNLSAGKPLTIEPAQYADGWPMPPLPPNSLAMNGGTLVADGWPMPPLPPQTPSIEDSTLVADGWPMPPLPPQSTQSEAFA